MVGDGNTDQQFPTQGLERSLASVGSIGRRAERRGIWPPGRTPGKKGVAGNLIGGKMQCSLHSWAGFETGVEGSPPHQPPPPREAAWATTTRPRGQPGYCRAYCMATLPPRLCPTTTGGAGGAPPGAPVPHDRRPTGGTGGTPTPGGEGV